MSGRRLRGELELELTPEGSAWGSAIIHEVSVRTKSGKGIDPKLLRLSILIPSGGNLDPALEHRNQGNVETG